MEFLFILLFVFLAIFLYKITGFAKRSDLDPLKQETYPYFKNTALLTPAEISFRHTLKMVVGNTYEINSKVRLADLISVHKGLSKSEWSKSFNQIKAKHLDFVLIDKETTEILCVIELDDATHNKPERHKRDNFLDAALKSANLPLLRFKAGHAYNSQKIGDAINSVFNSLTLLDTQRSTEDIKKTKILIEPDLDIDKDDELAIVKCPQCNAELVERQASKGRHVGVKFLGCSNFPNCRYRKVVGDRN